MHHAENEIHSESLIDYLLRRGWLQMRSEPDIAVLRKGIIDQEEEIVLPRDRSYADYRQRVLEAIEFLAKHECRSIDDILGDLRPQKWDVLQVRIRGERIGDGWISYFDKSVIEEGLKKLLIASARSVLDPKPYFKRLGSSTAEQWMKKCRSACPQPGSYILSVQMPLHEERENPELPFSRRVTEFLMKSLYRLVEMSERPEMQKESDYLNANLCLGLVGMKPDESPIHFDFEMKWSSEIPAKKEIPARIEIQDRHFSSIELIGQKLKPQTEIKQDLFVGKVLMLHGQADEDGKMQGEATLLLYADEEQIKAKAFFESSLYALACDAHKQNRYIHVSGILYEKPRYADLKDITRFEII